MPIDLNFGQMAGDMPSGAGPDYPNQEQLPPPNQAVRGYDVPMSEQTDVGTPEKSGAYLADVSNQIAAAGIMGDTMGLQQLITGALHRLATERLPEQPPGLADMGMIQDEDGNQVPLDHFVARTAAHADLTAGKIHSRIQSFLDSEDSHLRDAEQQALTDFNDATTEARYGMPAAEVNELKRLASVGTDSPDDPNAQTRARNALGILSRREQETLDPQPKNVWSNMSGYQAAMFVALNALSGSMKAWGYNGPTPLDVADRMMEQDLARQQQLSKNRDMKVARARSAYEIAAHHTDNEMQRELLARDMMWAPIEAEARAAGLYEAAAAITDKRAKLKTDYEVQMFGQKRASEAAMLGPAVSLLLGQQRTGAVGTAWRGKNALLQMTLDKISSLHTLSKFQQLWGESQQLAVGWLLGGAPGAITDANVYERLRRKLSIVIAAAENRGRPTKEDADAVYRALPGAGISGEGGQHLFDYQIHSAMDSAKLQLAGARASAGDDAVDYLLSKIDPDVVKDLDYTGGQPADPAGGFKREEQ